MDPAGRRLADRSATFGTGLAARRWSIFIAAMHFHRLTMREHRAAFPRFARLSLAEDEHVVGRESARDAHADGALEAARVGEGPCRHGVGERLR